MHILHGTWLPDKRLFFFWGEDASAELSFKRGKRSPRARHPFEVGAQKLNQHLKHYFPKLKTNTLRRVIHLPGVTRRPCPSPEAESSGAAIIRGAIRLLMWTVEGVTVRADSMLDIMLGLDDMPGVIIGSDLRYWQRVALYGLEVLSKQLYLPGLERDNGNLRAVWITRPMPERVTALKEAMPPISRAVIDEAEEAPPPFEILDSFLTELVDSSLRRVSINFASRPATAGEKWLRALLSRPDLNIPSADAQRLYEDWREWSEQLNVAGDSYFRVCLKLEAPSDGAEMWKLSYWLQAMDDPDVLVPAHQVWMANEDVWTFDARRFERPHEKLLSALGYVARVFPPLMKSLRTPAPFEAQLTTEEAYLFMKEAAPLLENSGFGVLPPAWWDKKTARLRTRAHLSANEDAALDMNSLVRYKWELSLGGEVLNRDEFEDLVARKQPLVKVRGQWVVLDPDEIESARRFFDHYDIEGRMPLSQAMQLALTGDFQGHDGLAVESIALDDWLEKTLLKMADSTQLEALSAPAGFNGTLRPYQQRGFAWMVYLRQLGLGGCLADDMGLGKTIQAIAFWLHEREKLGVERPALLACPTSVIGNWRHELARFAPELRVLKHHGPNRKHGTAFLDQVEDYDIVLTSYVLMMRDRETLEAFKWSSVILDEAQNIKNPSTKQAQAARAMHADIRYALTGTPIENRLQELWSIMHFLNPGYLGAQKAFRQNFAIPIERYGDEDAAEKLQKLIQPLVLRRLKTDPDIIQDLPEKLEMKVYCTLTPEQAALYRATVEESLAQVEESARDKFRRRGLVLAMLTRLKQICNHPAHFLKEGKVSAEALENRSGKLDRLIGMLEEVYAADDRALIFTQYAEMGFILQSCLRELFQDDVMFLHGGTPVDRREEMVRIFEAPRGPNAFILSLKAGGTGLNLTHANHVFHFDRWWNPAVEDQATDRAFRIGQTRNVQVHKFVCLGTLEEKIDALIDSKRALADSIIGGEDWLTELDGEELRELVALRADAVEGE
jgi:SNF2 family DNA or RNA helicase